MKCASCERLIERTSRVTNVCGSCYDRLPKVTRDLYESGKLAVKRVGELAKIRGASFKVVRAIK